MSTEESLPSMHFVLDVCCDNDAFHQNDMGDIRRILTVINAGLRSSDVIAPMSRQPVRDLNGNKCGYWQVRGQTKNTAFPGQFARISPCVFTISTSEFVLRATYACPEMGCEGLPSLSLLLKTVEAYPRLVAEKFIEDAELDEFRCIEKALDFFQHYLEGQADVLAKTASRLF